MQRVDNYREEAMAHTLETFALRWPMPVLLLRFVIEGELAEHGRGPEGTMRHSVRRSLSDHMRAPALPGRRKVGVERLAVVRHRPGTTIHGTFLIGRDTRCDVLLNDYTISAEHAKVHHLAQIGRWMIEDLGSTNRTFLNGGELPPFERGLLTSLDELQLGRMVFLYLEPKDLYPYLRGTY
ncbi:MAG: FHA domain-containing protein [Myxococcota bacterium]